MEECAEEDDIFSLLYLAWRYNAGRGVAKDKKKAIELFKRASDLGYIKAMYNLGVCYAKGDGVTQDKKNAIEIWQRASDMGNTVAMNNLGLCYEDGNGVPQDKKKAIELYQRASDMGNTKAMNNLARLKGEHNCRWFFFNETASTNKYYQ